MSGVNDNNSGGAGKPADSSADIEAALEFIRFEIDITDEAFTGDGDHAKHLRRVEVLLMKLARLEAAA